MSPEPDKLKVFAHQLYECKKGVRAMAMCSLPDSCLEAAKFKLDKNDLSYFIAPLTNGRSNLFFGEPICIEVARTFCGKPLNELSPQEDFILGALLGYSIPEQCRRYKTKIPARETALP